MPTNYDKLYQQQRHALGEPTKEFVDFFDQYEGQNAKILDIGCGQGRDALFIARRGHHVLAVDISATGIGQLLEDARTEGLRITGIVADLSEYRPSGDFDVVVIDRTLHMLAEDIRLMVLERLCKVTREGGSMLIADQKKNLPGMRQVFADDTHDWMILRDTKGFFFVQKGPSPSNPDK